MPIQRKPNLSAIRRARTAMPRNRTIYVRPGYNRVLAEEFEALKIKRAALVKDKVEAHSQGDLRENFGFKAAKDAIRAVDRKMMAIDRFVANNTFIEVHPEAWLTKPTDTVQLGHIVTVEKTDAATRRSHRFTFLIATYGETAIDPDTGIECLPHLSPIASVMLGLTAKSPTQVNLPAGPATITVHAIRNPSQAELDRLLRPLALTDDVIEENAED